MTTSRHYADHEGTFSATRPADRPCPRCGRATLTVRVWESSDGAYEDLKFECTDPACRHAFWVDGIDS